MIANNYAAMLFSQEISGDELSTDAILELHRILTQDTLDNRLSRETPASRR